MCNLQLVDRVHSRGAETQDRIMTKQRCWKMQDYISPAIWKCRFSVPHYPSTDVLVHRFLVLRFLLPDTVIRNCLTSQFHCMVDRHLLLSRIHARLRLRLSRLLTFICPMSYSADGWVCGVDKTWVVIETRGRAAYCTAAVWPMTVLWLQFTLHAHSWFHQSGQITHNPIRWPTTQSTLNLETVSCPETVFLRQIFVSIGLCLEPVVFGHHSKTD